MARTCANVQHHSVVSAFFNCALGERCLKTPEKKKDCSSDTTPTVAIMWLRFPHAYDRAKFRLPDWSNRDCVAVQRWNYGCSTNITSFWKHFFYDYFPQPFQKKIKTKTESRERYRETQRRAENTQGKKHLVLLYLKKKQLGAARASRLCPRFGKKPFKITTASRG